MKRLGLEDVCHIVECDRRICRYCIDAGQVYDLDKGMWESENGICAFDWPVIRSGQCASFKYRDKHMLPHQQKVLKV